MLRAIHLFVSVRPVRVAAHLGTRCFKKLQRTVQPIAIAIAIAVRVLASVVVVVQGFA